MCRLRADLLRSCRIVSARTSHLQRPLPRIHRVAGVYKVHRERYFIHYGSKLLSLLSSFVLPLRLIDVGVIAPMGEFILSRDVDSFGVTLWGWIYVVAATSVHGYIIASCSRSEWLLGTLSLPSEPWHKLMSGARVCLTRCKWFLWRSASKMWGMDKKWGAEASLWKIFPNFMARMWKKFSGNLPK